MGLTKSSTGAAAVDCFAYDAQEDEGTRIALAGNPNVGKSTVFNELTGMHQHTGNWPGKTVTGAKGECTYKDTKFTFVDLPGCYSLMAHSAEEEVARDFICFGEPDAVVVVCDATCLERNLNLVLQTIEITKKTIVCVNLMDEARKKKIAIDIRKLEQLLGVPVVCTAARSGTGLEELLEKLEEKVKQPNETSIPVVYEESLEKAIHMVEKQILNICKDKISPRWTALKLIEGDVQAIDSVTWYLETDIKTAAGESVESARALLNENEMNDGNLQDKIVSSIVKRAEEIAEETVTFENEKYDEKDRKIDRILTGKWGFGVMLFMLLIIFWLTIAGSNYPSQLLSAFLFQTEEWIYNGLSYIGCPVFILEMAVHGLYRMLIWVVSVMLPPMAIFFPLFTLLEDLGYLPRVAFNLDKCFKKCSACGKQALTMCMGFGCNAAGVVGCRIIDSPRERLIAMITNNFVPCNGRFPTLISIISMFVITAAAGFWQSAGSAVVLLGVIMLGIFMTFLVSKLLSVTVLKGVPSSFTLELPPYRKPQIGKVLIRSIFDRTLFVLGRAAAVAAPAGLIIWLMANVTVGGNTLLAICCGALDPFGRAIGMDGVIIMAFILGFPANETVIPIMLMAYLSGGSLMEAASLSELRQVLVSNGWTYVTAINVMLFSLMHWPCSTTLMTIKKESGSMKWTLAAAAIPTVMGIGLCFLVTLTAKFVTGII